MQKSSSKASLVVDINGNKCTARDNHWPFNIKSVIDLSQILNPLCGFNSRFDHPRLRGGANNDKQSTQSMVDIAIQNAARHGIGLHQGVPNLANGNCIFESIIDNISTRGCFKESFDGEPDYYRRLWLDEAENAVFNFSGSSLSAV